MFGIAQLGSPVGCAVRTTKRFRAANGAHGAPYGWAIVIILAAQIRC
jgi:hypothetical protein